MFSCEKDCVKFEVHSTESELPQSFPGVKIIKGSDQFHGFTLHKWKEESPKGEFLALVIIQEEIEDFFDKLPKFDLNDIMSGEEVKNVVIYKYHSNQWREVKFKKKWTYVDKLIKGDSNIQRILR